VLAQSYIHSQSGKIYLGKMMPSATGWILNYSITHSLSEVQSGGHTQTVQKQSVRIALSKCGALRMLSPEMIDTLSKAVLAQKIEELPLGELLIGA